MGESTPPVFCRKRTLASRRSAIARHDVLIACGEPSTVLDWHGYDDTSLRAHHFFRATGTDSLSALRLDCARDRFARSAEIERNGGNHVALASDRASRRGHRDRSMR